MRIYPTIFLLLLCTMGTGGLPFASAQQYTPGKKQQEERKKLAKEIETSMRKQLLDIWYPRSVDSIYGGFLSNFSFDFQPTGIQDKMIVTQARHVWSNSVAARIYPGEKHFHDAAKQGFDFLKRVMWDQANGGLFTLVTREGKLKDSTHKTAYGNAFGIYACAAWYKTSGDTEALELAKKCFYWLEEKSHDKIYKGYCQDLSIEGKPLKRDENTPSTSSLGYKDQNSSIHLLEAFTELYEVWPDSLLRTRLQEMLLLVRDVQTSHRGNLILYFQPDWTPISFRDSSESIILTHKNLDHVSFGHDIETAYLLLEASHVLGWKKDDKTMRIAKKMVDHTINTSWDGKNGGFFDEGYYFKNKTGITIIKNSKNWWAQAEALNSLLLMADHFPHDRMQYFQKFKQQWQYIKTYIIDPVHGDWFEEGLDTRPERKTSLKGHIWKGTYHHLRSMSNCIKHLRN
jgi:cellobiose epimerase